ncbi:hypothetical protein [Halorhabdus salina]|nr:hypothetical protein [Halorhabdus salina]
MGDTGDGRGGAYELAEAIVAEQGVSSGEPLQQIDDEWSGPPS